MNRTFEERLAGGILLLDGAMGTMLQRRKLQPEDYQKGALSDHPQDLYGNHDILNLTAPEVIRSIHLEYLCSGADIIETNTFSSNRISQKEYQAEGYVKELNQEAVRIAREAIQESGKQAWVAGSIGPTSVTLSLSKDVENPGARECTFEEMAQSYREQIESLCLAGVDLLLLETIFDTLNAKSALWAMEKVFESLGRRWPVIVSGTITDQSGRTLTGQTLQAFWHSIKHVKPLAVGLNCALGAAEMREHLRELSQMADCYLCCYPNAGLPNALGEYDQTPEEMAQLIVEFAQEGLLNIVGGCCGTGPEHISLISKGLEGQAARVVPSPQECFVASGLECCQRFEGSGMILVGERTNVMGSPKFARLIREGDLEAALEVARQQVESGANLLDVNMDEGLLDSASLMRDFLNLLAAEPDISRVPLMIDSSRWEVLIEGLRACQGRCVVNSISLKEGEESFRQQALEIKHYGANVIAMAFDEEGQADCVERKVEIAQRAYKILLEVGYQPWEILFDPNVLTVATGLEEHDRYGLDFIEALREIKKCCPGMLTVAGVSNLSFAFRGQNKIREAMHSVFLYHAMRAGLDVAIVNAGMLAVYQDLDPVLRDLVEDVVLARSSDATEKLLAYAQDQGEGASQGGESQKGDSQGWRALEPVARMTYRLVHGRLEYLEEDLQELSADYPQPIDMIEGPLMEGMGEVGRLFGAGEMFLPQVVKSARVMKRAVSFLTRDMDASDEGTSKEQPTIVMATVKGDVHDIGKNIVSVVLGCNGYRVVDLGVMVEGPKILEVAKQEGADAIGLSGLITPSLDEMVKFAKLMQEDQLEVPLLIGGATTSETHTALKIVGEREGPTIYVKDASQASGILKDLFSDPELFWKGLSSHYQQVRERYLARQKKQVLLPLSEVRSQGFEQDWESYLPPQPLDLERYQGVLTATMLQEWIDWTPFFNSWQMKGTYPSILENPVATELHEKALEIFRLGKYQKGLKVNYCWQFYSAYSEGDDLYLVHEGQTRKLLTLRQQRERRKPPYLALSDWISPKKGEDYLGALTVGIDQTLLEPLLEECRQQEDDYTLILLQSLADRLAEAAAEYVHWKMRQHWGIAVPGTPCLKSLLKESYQGIRPAPGYPACPAHESKTLLFELLQPEKIGVELTEQWAMKPASAVCSWVLSHPQSRYFAVGKLARDQVEDFARRKGWEKERAEEHLAFVLGYDA